MLVRFQVNNMLSFGEEREFNMLPAPRYSKLGHHKYNIKELELLKLSSIYGANGSGKSNLVKCLAALKTLIVDGEIPADLSSKKFKLSKKKLKDSQVFTIEFFKKSSAYYYSIVINKGIVITEMLSESGLGKNEDVVLFERKTDKNGKTSLKFMTEFENDNESKTLKSVIEKTLSKPEKPLFKLLSQLDNDLLSSIKNAFEWFDKDLVLIYPASKPQAVIKRIENDVKYKEFVNKTMCAFDLGIKKIETETKTIKEFFGEDKHNIERISKMLNENPSGFVGLTNPFGEEVLAVKKNGELLIKRIVLVHQDIDNNNIEFYFDEESDGTNRLFDYIPVFQDIIYKQKTFIIDEIERSIHPLLIKELITKFSNDKNTKGQLIFTTHESNLLDQSILRQDEIWFMEKDKFGCSDMYPLSEFKEHHTKDIKKGYLMGRYGAIPFLGNLENLNWNNYGTAE